MWPGMGIVGVGMILALIGLFALIPGAVHAVLLIALFGAMIYAFWRQFARVRGPGRSRCRAPRGSV